MKIKYQPTFSDYWALNIHSLRKQFGGISILAILMVGVFPFSSFFVRSENGSVLDSYIRGAGILILPGIVCFTVVATFLAAKKRWVTSKELNETKEYDITDDRIRLISESADISLVWSIFKEAEITADWVYLSTAQNQYHYFPVKSVPEIEEVKRILRANIDRCIIKKGG
jgi:hypothetical protein